MKTLPLQMNTAELFETLDPSAGKNIDYVVLDRSSFSAVSFDELYRIVAITGNRKKLINTETGKKEFQNMTFAIDGETAVITIHALRDKIFNLPIEKLTAAEMHDQMDQLHANYRAYLDAQNETTKTEMMDFGYKGNAHNFSFILANLYEYTKRAHINDVLSFNNVAHFPLRPIRDMFRTCSDKMIHWDCKIETAEDTENTPIPLLVIDFHDIIKTRFTVKGWFELPYSLKKRTVYSWDLPVNFFTDWPEPETAEIAPQPAEIAPQPTPEPDPVETITEIPETTPEPQPEPTETPETAVPTPAKPKPRKRRQPAQKRVKMPKLPKEWEFRTPDWFVPITA